MKKITKADIRRLEKELKAAKDIKRRVFLKATINIYSEKLGLECPYPKF
ncbi:MAG: hypothetical protein IJJ01_05860 [Firmicutes bacterium]|nr:hypothetical protein [Bacillota bacterium]